MKTPRKGSNKKPSLNYLRLLEFRGYLVFGQFGFEKERKVKTLLIWSNIDKMLLATEKLTTLPLQVNTTDQTKGLCFKFRLETTKPILVFILWYENMKHHLVYNSECIDWTKLRPRN